MNYVLLLDVHSMYCSAEAIFRADLRNKPIAVGSNGDGIVVAANRAAKALGVKKFQSVASQKYFFESGKCALFSSNYTLYNELSTRFVECLRNQDLLTRIEPYSIDEVFGTVPNFLTDYQDLLSVSRQLRRAVWDQVRLPIGIGCGRTFTLAKAASYIGKNVSGYRGICVTVKDSEPEHLSLVPLNEIWNIGKASTDFLKKQGINTALDLRKVDPKQGRMWLGVNLERTIRELRGEKVYGMDSFPDINTRKEVSSAISLTVRAECERSLHQALSLRIAVATEKMRKLGLSAKHMILFAQSSRFDPDYKSYQVSIEFDYRTDDTRLFIKALTHSMKRLFHEGTSYYKIGCRLLGLEQVQYHQQDLFAPPPAPKLMDAMDKLNEKYGFHVLTLGSVSVSNEAAMLRKHLSPSYLTDWKDLLRVKC